MAKATTIGTKYVMIQSIYFAFLFKNKSHIMHNTSHSRAYWAPECFQTYTPITESIDLWVALLSERKSEGTIFGETMKHFLLFTFTNLRDGDRFYFEVDPVLNAEDINLIREVKFSYLVLANTAIKKMQSLVFNQVNYTDVCEKMDLEASFSFRNVNEVPISNMGVYFSNQVIRSTNALGEFSVKNLSACKAYEFVLATDVANPLAGLSTKDILLIQNHILGNNRIKSIPSLVAADVDNSGVVSSMDIIMLRKILLGNISDFVVENSWQYVTSSASTRMNDGLTALNAK